MLKNNEGKISQLNLKKEKSYNLSEIFSKALNCIVNIAKTSGMLFKFKDGNYVVD